MAFFIWMIIIFFPWSSVFQEKKFNMAPIASRKKVFPLARLTALQSAHRWTVEKRHTERVKNKEIKYSFG